MATLKDALGVSDISWRTWQALSARQQGLVADGAFSNIDARTHQQQKAIDDAQAVQQRTNSREHNRAIAHGKVSTSQRGVVFKHR